ncbi:hypothetical protein KU855_09625 [Shewanella sp. NIFS-20-20]|nr:hypothetical protein [Shewanella sp. NIFS-20-20]
MNMNRRNAMGSILGIAGLAAGGVLAPSQSFAALGHYQLALGDKLKYVPLDAMATAKLAYETGGGCMHQVFHAMVTMLAASSSVDGRC